MWLRFGSSVVMIAKGISHPAAWKRSGPFVWFGIEQGIDPAWQGCK